MKETTGVTAKSAGAEQTDAAGGLGGFVKRAGWACVGAGILGGASAAYLTSVTPQVPIEQWSYPLAPTGFAAIQIWFMVQHVGLLAGIIALPRTGAFGDRARARRANTVAVGGLAALTATELVAIWPAKQSVSDPVPMALGAVYGLLTAAIGVALVVAGLGVLRAGV